MDYHFQRANVVFIRHVTYGHIFLKDNGELTALRDYNEKNAQWNTTIIGKNQIQFQNVANGKYLAINKNDTVSCDIDDSKDESTIFEYHILQAPNGVKLESVHFKDKYIIGEKIVNIKNNDNDKKENDSKMNENNNDTCLIKAGTDNKVGPCFVKITCVNLDDYMEEEKGLTKDEKEVRRWLEGREKEAYLDKFIKAGYNSIDKLRSITQDEIESFGIDSATAKRMARIAFVLELQKESK